MKNLLVIGAGGHGHAVKEVAQEMNRFHEIAFLDDKSEEAIGMLCDYKNFRKQFAYLFVAIGNSQLREKWILKAEKAGYIIPTLIHPKASISKSCQIKEGVVIMQGASIQTNSRINKGSIISTGAIVDHDANVEAYCHVNAGAIVASMTTVPTGTKIDYNIVYR